MRARLPRVRKRPLGKTGLYVSEMGIGTWGLSGECYGPVDEKDAETVVRRCLSMGANLVDTADSYGAGRMEAMLGRVLKGRRDVVVVTKGGTDRTTDPPRKRFDADYLKESVGRSLKRLGRDRIDVYLLHNPSLDALAAGDCVKTMEELKKKGDLAHWGVSAGSDEIARAAIDAGAEVIEIVYNLMQCVDLHRVAGDVMVSGVGVLARSVLDYGLLAGGWEKDREFPEGDHRSARWTKLELERRVEQVDAVRFLVKGDIRTMRAAAVRFVLANTIVSSAVLGPRTVEQAEQLVREAGGALRYLPDEALASLPRALAKVGILS
jgi:aryl-alcohol dehydrogenase-like predicted oxidoreductase